MKKKKKIEDDLRRKRGEIVVSDEEDPMKKSLPKPNAEQQVGVHIPKFNTEGFEYQREMENLCNGWGKAEAPPPDLSQEIDRSPEASVLRGENFGETYVKLLASKNVDHI